MPLLAALAALQGVGRIEKSGTTAAARSDGAVAFTRAKFASLRAEGKAVFVDMTADWCTTCKVNERAVLAHRGVPRAAATHGHGVHGGDWTDPNPRSKTSCANSAPSARPYVVFPRGGGPGCTLPTVRSRRAACARPWKRRAADVNVRQILGILLLAVLAGAGGVVAAFSATVPPPRWVCSSARRWRPAWAWSEATRPPPRPVAGRGAGGRVAPDPALVDVDGRARSPSVSHRLLINFWVAWCAPCREEMPALDQVRERQEPGWRGRIALDDAEAVRAGSCARRRSTTRCCWPRRTPPIPRWRFGDTRGALPYSVLAGADGLHRSASVPGARDFERRCATGQFPRS